MDWTQTLTIIGVNLALIGIMISLLIWAVNRIESDVQAIGRRLDGHAHRIDQLYKMFVDLLKNRE